MSELVQDPNATRLMRKLGRIIESERNRNPDQSLNYAEVIGALELTKLNLYDEFLDMIDEHLDEEEEI